MTITSRIHEELFVPTAAAATGARLLVRMPLTHPRGAAPDPAKASKRQRRRRRRPAADPKTLALAWSADEHERFLRGLELFPRGPWKDVAHFVGTRTVRQTMTHAQKYRQKIARHKRGLQQDATRKAAAASPPPASAESAATVSPVLGATVQSPVWSDPAASCAAPTPGSSAPGPQSIYSPSSAEELAFGLQVPPPDMETWQGMAPAAGAMLLAPYSPPASPHALHPFDCFESSSAAAAPTGESDEDRFSFPLDDGELDALMIDDVLLRVITEYLGPCPINDSDATVS